MIEVIIFAAIWLGWGYVAAGIAYAYNQKHWPTIADSMRGGDYFASWAVGLLPTFNIIAPVMCAPWRYGICWNWIMKPDLSAPPSPQNGQPQGVSVAASIANSLTLAQVRASVAALKNTTPWALPDLPKIAGTEPIVAYRVWKLNRDNGHLKSTYMSDYEWPFRRRLVSDDFDSRGIHAVKDIQRLVGSEPSAADPAGLYAKTSLWSEYAADIAGEVYLWGEVKEHRLGYTAQYAYPKQLWVPVDTDPLVIMQLEENYGVPVSERKEFKKHVSAPDLSQSQYFQYAALWPATFTNQCTKCGTFFNNGVCQTCHKTCPLCGQPLSSQQGACLNSSCTAISAQAPSLLFPLFNCGNPNCGICGTGSSGLSTAIVPYKP